MYVATKSDKHPAPKRPGRSATVLKSRLAHGVVNIAFSKSMRDKLRAIAVIKDQTFLSLLNQLSSDYINAWEARTGLSVEDLMKSSEHLEPAKTRAQPQTSAVSRAKPATKGVRRPPR